MRTRRTPAPSSTKSFITLAILVAVFMASSTLFSMYPQNIYIENNSKISVASFTSNNTAMVKGNQVSFGQDDLIFLEGREYIRITGNQQSIGEYKLTPAIRTLSTSLMQNPLFETKVGSFSVNSGASIIVDESHFSLIPISANILKVQGEDTNFNLNFVASSTYIKVDDNLFRISKDSASVPTFTVYLAGLSSPTQIAMVTI